MDVAVITRHAITNYGSMLQAYATQEAIGALGHNCQIIDYIRYDEQASCWEATLLKNKSRWNKSIISRAAYLFVRQPESIVAGKRFERERKNYLNLTSRYNSIRELEDNPPKADIYMTGSDQVWGPTASGELDLAYALTFIRGSKKVSYAASFGKTELNDDVRRRLTRELDQYSYITVREDSAVTQLREWGINSKQVLDPTFLLTSDQWSKIAQPINLPEQYVLIYQIHNDKTVGRYAKRVAKHLGLPLFRVSAYLHQIGRGGRLKWMPSIAHFLSLIKNASCLVTDSFHGTALAINFNVPFIEVLPNTGTASRNQSILNLLELQSRVLQDEEDVSLADTLIDYRRVNQLLSIYRAESMEKLKEIIEEI